MTHMVPVQVIGIHVDPDDGTAAVLLAESAEPVRVLPIVTGIAEAQSIATALAGVELPRPGTHDLTLSLLAAADARLDEVAITELRDGIFYAELFVETASEMEVVSARPSDGIALAVRVGVPIAVAEEVLDTAAVTVVREGDEPLDEAEIERIVSEFHGALETATPEDIVEAGPLPDDDPGAGDVDGG
jgi:bifunctional DNase/RNase